MRPRQYRIYLQGIGEVAVKAHNMELNEDKTEYVLKRDDETVGKVLKSAVLMWIVD